MFRLIALAATFYVGYEMGKKRAGDLTASYIVSRSRLLGNVSTIEYLKVNQDGSTQFVTDEADATPLNYREALEASNFVKSSQLLNLLKVDILPLNAPATV